MKLCWTVAVLVFVCFAGLGEGQMLSSASSRSRGPGMSSRGSFRAGLFNSELMENPYMMAIMMSNMMGMKGTQAFNFNLPMMYLLGGSGLEVMPMDSLMSFFLMQSLFNNPTPGSSSHGSTPGMSQMPITDVSFLLPQLAAGSSGGMTGNLGGIAGSSGGMTGNLGGMTGSSGGMTGSLGGMAGSLEGLTGSLGGMTGSSASSAGSAV
ncbi:uncharacterized protein LOC125666470 [Ostrea edulis]|uniref:uncharacterized protein LOC125666470 n=1 Tax=Ostrea edulis TaxID=37623 RepID=UPI0024AE8D89|nr:uncharacterized protein LOC125666470 [Ostrea edulis]